jgi:hypothetical protein
MGIEPRGRSGDAAWWRDIGHFVPGFLAGFRGVDVQDQDFAIRSDHASVGSGAPVLASGLAPDNAMVFDFGSLRQEMQWPLMAMSLTRLHPEQGRQADARPILAGRYDLSTEDSRPLTFLDAKPLLAKTRSILLKDA